MISSEYGKLHAFREALADTSVALVINAPLNFFMVWLCVEVWQLSALWASLILTLFFTVIALIRKTYTRMHFHQQYQKHRCKPQRRNT